MRTIAALLAMPLAASAEVITYHPGGIGTEGMRLARQANLEIHGICNSACAWGAWSNPRMCYGANAHFYFHTPADPGTGKPAWGAVAYWSRATPKWVFPELRVSAQDLDKIAPGRRCKQ